MNGRRGLFGLSGPGARSNNEWNSAGILDESAWQIVREDLSTDTIWSRRERIATLIACVRKMNEDKKEEDDDDDGGDDDVDSHVRQSLSHQQP